jgi:ESS family glutamate:Na+ symporter
MEPAIGTIYLIDPIQMLGLSVVVLTLGMYVNRHVAVLERNYIPPAVTGGLLFSVVTTSLYAFADIELDFDMQLRDLLLIIFFTTVGLSSRLRSLISGGKAFVILVGLAGLFLFLQDTLAVGLAFLFDRHPGYGLMAGSVSLAGGHGTAAAWGAQVEASGLPNASMVGLVFATFGLVAGGLLGGPIARWLIEKNGLDGTDAEVIELYAPGKAVKERRVLLDDEPLFPVFRALFVLAVCASLGAFVNQYVSHLGILLPGFLTAMLVGIILSNVMEHLGRPPSTATLKAFGSVSLQIFLTMSMMDLQLWLLADAFLIVVSILLCQIVLMSLFSIYVVFRLMGKDYDAAVMAAGFVGLGLGATPVAIANMEAVSRHYGPSIKAFLVIPLIGAFFIDLLNAGVINLFINLFGS